MLHEIDLPTLERSLTVDAETTVVDDAAADGWTIHGVRPRLVCAPPTPEALAATLSRCDRAGAAVIPWGGGTQQRLGLPPRRADVVLSTRRLSRLVEYEPANLTVTVEAGMRLSDFQAILANRGQWLPTDPPVHADATVGGLLATNVTGPRRLRDGGLRDLVIGTRVANVDGTVTRAGGRVVKNVTGYDLNKLHVGALGTLGVVVEATFKIAPRPETERTWVGIFPTAEAAAGVVGRLLRLPLAPTALDLLNDRTARQLGLPVPHDHWALLGRADGFRPAVDRHVVEFDRAARLAGAVDAQVLGDNQAGPLWTAYAEKAAAFRWSAGPLTCRLAVPPAAVGSLSDRLVRTGAEPAVWAHATGAVFWSVPADASLMEPGTITALRDLAETVGGRLVVENCPAVLTGVDVWGPPGGPLPLMRAVRQQYDPNGTLNPGRYVGGI